MNISSCGHLPPKVFTNTRTRSVPKLKIPTRWALLTVETVGTVETVDSWERFRTLKAISGWDWMGWDWIGWLSYTL